MIRGKRFLVRSAAAMTALMMILAVAPPAAIGADSVYEEIVKVKFLSSGAWTSGPEKSFGYSFHKTCGAMDAQVDLTYYYNLLTATNIRITKVRAKYYIYGPATGTIYGGWMYEGNTAGGPAYNIPNNQYGEWGDSAFDYPYNSATRDVDGYSYVGQYVHGGTYPAPVNISSPGRDIYIYKRMDFDYRRYDGNVVCEYMMDFGLEVSW